MRPLSFLCIVLLPFSLLKAASLTNTTNQDDPISSTELDFVGKTNSSNVDGSIDSDNEQELEDAEGDHLNQVEHLRFLVKKNSVQENLPVLKQAPSSQESSKQETPARTLEQANKSRPGQPPINKKAIVGDLLMISVDCCWGALDCAYLVLEAGAFIVCPAMAILPIAVLFLDASWITNDWAALKKDLGKK